MSSHNTSSRPLVIDGLNCAGLTREQLIRTREGGVSAINLTAIHPDAELADALIQLEEARRVIEAMPDVATVVTSVAEIRQAHDEHRVGVIFGAQNTLMAEPDVRILASFKQLGMRIIQPTYNEKNRFGYGAPFVGDTDKGMTEAAYDWLAEMERQRLLVDLSHCGHRTSADFVRAAKRPLVISHGNAYALCPSPRNKPDSVIRAVAENGGLVGAVSWSPIVRWDKRPTLDDLAAHVAYMVKIGGIDHVAFASDLPEANGETEEEWEARWGKNGLYPNITGSLGPWYGFGTHVTEGYESMAKTPAVWDAMGKQGFHEREIEKIMSGNWMRVLEEVW
ncbi:membrane dipeptidase [Sodalis sp. dw_96]|uniref:dipeptidase n=1 Tax=Sodalis sp. dw_96 TaxID=2719794 RepID=UPI001BD523CB|nr:membrane dipeptidase [Sodalis sp. dw_96]